MADSTVTQQWKPSYSEQKEKNEFAAAAAAQVKTEKATNNNFIIKQWLLHLNSSHSTMKQI